MKDNNNKKSYKPAPEKKAINNIKPIIETPDIDSYPGISNVASTGECTGLMYAPPQNREEFESYQELSSMELPKKKKEQ